MASFSFLIMLKLSVLSTITAAQSCTNYSDNRVLFIQEPVDTSVCVNSTAYFHCHITGVSTRPHWIINSVVYSSSSLPRNTIYDDSTNALIVNNVRPDENNSTYQCFITLFDGVELCSYYSSVGRLQVYTSDLQGACVCQADEDSICSCVRDNVTVILSYDLLGNRTEELRILVFCSHTIELYLRAQSEFGFEASRPFLCDGVEKLGGVWGRGYNNSTSCRNASYYISAIITSFRNKTLLTSCPIGNDLIVDLKSTRCSDSTERMYGRSNSYTYYYLALTIILAISLCTILIVHIYFVISHIHRIRESKHSLECAEKRPFLSHIMIPSAQKDTYYPAFNNNAWQDDGRMAGN